MKHFVAVVIGIALLPVALARAAQRTDQRSAEEHLTRGVELRRQGQTEQALAEFQRAHAASPSGRTLAQMGLAEQALKRWADAEKHLAEALEELGGRLPV